MSLVLNVMTYIFFIAFFIELSFQADIMLVLGFTAVSYILSKFIVSKIDINDFF